jgi:hypothetical protein
VIAAAGLTAIHAHVAGLPIEETILQVATAGAALVAGLRLTRARTRGWTARLGSRLARRS